MIMVFLLSGCGEADSGNPKIEVSEALGLMAEKEENGHFEAEHIFSLYGDLYEKAQEAGTLGDLEVMRDCAKRLGEEGYAVVDEENQMDMINPEQVRLFCEAVDQEQPAELTLIVLDYSGGFLKYDLRTTDGRVEIDREYEQVVNGSLENSSTASYTADTWQYTKEGYLVFAGTYYSESYHVLLSSDVSEYAAIRVEPLKEACRALNRQYLLPVGYGQNNLFLVDWTETDYGELDFYDQFDQFYPRIYRRSNPYVADDNLNVGAVYQIPADTFETVIGSYYKIEQESLRQKITYVPETETYEYRPRGFYESGYEDIPYPEVVSYEKNSDGTITLLVNAVYPKENTSRAFAHKTVIRPLADGSFQYVSNQMVYPEEGYDSWWYAKRMPKEQWQETYGHEAGSLLSEAEKETLGEEALAAAGKVGEIYKDAVVEEDLIYGHVVKDFSREQRNRVVSLLGKAGCVSVTDGANMENPDLVQDFYDAYQEKQDAMVTVYEIHPNGVIGACTFVYRAGKIQTYYLQIAWQKGGIPEITSVAVSDVKQMKLTPKGYFIYAYEDTPYHASLRQYWRVAPLSDECMEMTEKYVQGISYVNYNLLVTDWNSDNVEDILMPCMFADIYRIAMGEALQPVHGEIPADLYERIMTTYFPVTIQQVREICGYHADTDSYPYEMIFARQYPPFGEVVDFVENPDGTLTLSVDGVWPDYDSDCAFTNRILIQPFADGSFRYLSNTIEKGELEIPMIEP